MDQEGILPRPAETAAFGPVALQDGGAVYEDPTVDGGTDHFLQATDQLRPVALQLGSAERIGFEIQQLKDGRSMIFIPSVPNTWSGITQILPADQVTYLDVPATQIIEFVERYGYDVDLLLDKKVDERPTKKVISSPQAEDEASDD